MSPCVSIPLHHIVCLNPVLPSCPVFQLHHLIQHKDPQSPLSCRSCSLHAWKHGWCSSQARISDERGLALLSPKRQPRPSKSTQRRLRSCIERSMRITCFWAGLKQFEMLSTGQNRRPACEDLPWQGGRPEPQGRLFWSPKRQPRSSHSAQQRLRSCLTSLMRIFCLWAGLKQFVMVSTGQERRPACVGLPWQAGRPEPQGCLFWSPLKPQGPFHSAH